MQIKLPLLGRISIFIRDKELEVFSTRQFFNYVREENSLLLKDEYVNILTEIDYDYYLKNHANFQYSRNFVCKNNTIDYQNISIDRTKRGKIEIKIKTNGSVLAKIFKKLHFKNINEKLYAQYHSLFYQTILFPIFSLYAITGNYFLIHGSLIKYKSTYLLISGLDGVGKSTLTNMLVMKGATCLADNFVLFNGTDAIPLALTIRLSPDAQTSMKVIYKDDNLIEALPHNNIDTEYKIVPHKIYLLCVTDSLNIQDICIPEINWLLYMNNAPEICDANRFIGPLLVNDIGKTTNKSNIDITILGIPYGQLEVGRRIILNECQNVCPR